MEKAIIKPKDANSNESEVLKVDFNPENYSISKGSDIKTNKDISNQGLSNQQIFLGDKDTFSTVLYFDDSETGNDVRIKLKKLENCLEKVNKSKKEVIFAWGDFIFEGNLTSLNEEYIMFNEKGTPIRAKVSISILGKMQDFQSKSAQSSKSETKQVVVNPMETLSKIADAYLQDSSRWPEIAKENNISNPRKIQDFIVNIKLD